MRCSESRAVRSPDRPTVDGMPATSAVDALLVVSGVKPAQTALADSEYELVRDLADTVEQNPPPFAVADDFARELLAEDDD